MLTTVPTEISAPHRSERTAAARRGGRELADDEVDHQRTHLGSPTGGPDRLSRESRLCHVPAFAAALLRLMVDHRHDWFDHIEDLARLDPDRFRASEISAAAVAMAGTMHQRHIGIGYPT